MNKKYLREIGRCTIFKKRKRSFLSIGATAISTAVLTVSLLLLLFVFNIISKDIDNVDHYHYKIDTNSEISFSSRYDVWKEYDTNIVINTKSLYSIVTDGEVQPFNSFEGSMPINKEQIIVSKSMGNIGDIIDGYEVVGVYESDSTNRVYSVGYEGDLERCYLLDDFIYLQSSQNDLISYYMIDEDDVSRNLLLIQKDTIEKNLENGPVILFILIIVVGLCSIMSIICLNNIMIVTDQSRKKEFGLLKSVGCSSQGIRYLIIYELVILGVIGSIIGATGGSLLAYYILQFVSEHLYLEMAFTTFYFVVIILSGIFGFLLLLYSGYRTYNGYIYSSPISDIKESVFDFTDFKVKESKSKHSFSWDMFIKYNLRMKKQAKNITISFCLLLISAILFASIFLICLVYNNTYTNSEYDYVLKGNGITNDEMIEQLETMEYVVELEDFRVERQTYVNMIVDAKNFNLERLKSYLETAKEVYYGEKGSILRANVRFQTLYMRNNQIEDLKPYLIWGRAENLAAREVVVVLDKDDYYGYEMCKYLDNEPHMVFNYGDLFKVDPEFYAEWKEHSNNYYNFNSEGNPDEFEIVGIAVLSDEESKKFAFPFEIYPRVVIIDVDATKSIPHRVYDTISYRLGNKNDIVILSQQIENLKSIYDKDQAYEIRNYAIETVSNQSVVFILEIIIYPVFALLFLIAVINIYYVLTGNLYLKQNDISIFKSIGIKTKQLKNIFWLEYMESYLNACWITCLIFIPIAFIQSKITVLQSFDFASNLLGTLIIALFIFAPLVLVSVILIHIQQIKKIKPLSSKLEGN